MHSPNGIKLEEALKKKNTLMIDNLSLLDNLVIILYFAVVLIIGFYNSKLNRKNKEEYFLAGRKNGWFVIGLSLFATNISSEHFVGLAGAGAEKGLIVGQFELLAVIPLFLLGWLFAPVFLKTKVFTTPEYLTKRFDDRVGMYLTTISIVLYILTKIAFTLYAGGILFKEVLGWNMFASAVILVFITGIYTVIGGMKSVIQTQIFQAFLIILGSVLLTAYGLNAVGGWDTLLTKLPERYFSMIRPASDAEFPWTGIFIGAPIIGIWYWCTDQVIVQRILSAKNIEQARKGTLFAAYLKMLPIFILVLPGIIAIVLYPGIKGTTAFSYMISGDLLPQGIKGLVITGLFAALMSSLASVFNSISALFTIDIYKKFNPNSSDENTLLFSRLITTFVVLSAILFIPLLKIINSDIYVNLQGLQAYISPPIVAVFLVGIFWKKANSNGALYTFIIGGLLSLSMLLLSYLNRYGILENNLIREIARLNFLHFAIVLFFISIILMIVISKISQIESKNYSLINIREIIIKQKLNRSEVVYSVFLLLLFISLWGYFN